MKTARLPSSYEAILYHSLTQGTYELPLRSKPRDLPTFLNRMRVAALCKQKLLIPIGDLPAVVAHQFILTEEGKHYLEQFPQRVAA